MGKYIKNTLDNDKKSEISSIPPILPHLNLTPTPSTSKNIDIGVQDDVKKLLLKDDAEVFVENDVNHDDDSRDTDILPIHTPSFGKININNIPSILSPPKPLSTPHHHQTMTPHENVDR